MKETIYDIIRTGKRHANYEYICRRTKAWRAIVGGEGIDEYYQRFNPRETEEQFEQRKRLTQQIATSVCKNIRDIEYKVPRSNGIQRVVDVTEQGKAASMQTILDEFWGDSTLDDYIDVRWVELNDSDPNAFIVLEWQPFGQDEYAAPYPYEVKSEEAVYYEYINNKLQYLVACVDIEGDLKRFTGYFKEFTIVLTQIPDEEAKKLNMKEDEERTANGVLYVRLNDSVYTVFEAKPHGLGYVPAFQPGYVRDQATNGHTFLPPWWAAESILMNLIKSKSELDLSVALHVFPQKLQYVPNCNNPGCISGTMADGKQCPVCKGTGYQTITSAQDAIYLALPRKGHENELFNLQQLVHYVYPPIDLVRFMDEYVDKLSRRAMQFVYNSEIYSRQQVAETATGRNIDMQAVYDTLYPMAKAMARDWEFMVATVGDITGIQCTPTFTFSKDFKLKSLDEYYQDLVTLGNSSPFVKSAIEDDIARIIYADNPEGMARHLTKKAFFPFPGDSPETISLKMSQSFVPKFYKVLYSAYGWIFDDLERENKGFWALNRTRQWELLDAKVNEYLAADEPEPVFTPETMDENETE